MTANHCPECPDCHGTGVRNSGRAHPSGEPALIACDCFHPCAQQCQDAADVAMTEYRCANGCMYEQQVATAHHPAQSAERDSKMDLKAKALAFGLRTRGHHGSADLIEHQAAELEALRVDAERFDGCATRALRTPTWH